MATMFPLLADADEVAGVVEDARREVRYLITDFSAELVISKFKEKAESEGDIYVPDYQRGLAWTEDTQSYFIESLILRVPIPPVFFYEVEGKLEIVDGSQRIRTIVSFAKDGFALRGLEKLDILNGFEFSKLPLPVQRRLYNTPIRSYVLDQGIDESTRVDLFRRLNTSGKKLQDAEIRKGAFRGPFLDLVVESAASDIFLQVTPHIGGRSASESERQELVTRFFIYARKYMDFRHDVRRFLDANMVIFNKSLNEGELQSMRAEFSTTMKFILENYPKAFYRTEKGHLVPRVRFEAVAVGTALALRQNQNLQVGNSDWLRSAEFEQLVRTDASNSAPKLRSRIEFVRDRLLGV
ncbi:MAG TPA: DUF262 domain-containing protein [Xanthobacteraceae bacterium]|jgi:hypothetical protein|nr:DUF262 domain-containing protein [Xanthobacteraceae bacterium]